MLDNLRADTRRLKEIKPRRVPWYVLESLLFENGYQAVVLYRIAHWFKSRGFPALGPLLSKLSVLLTGVEIAPGATIGPGLFISHGVGLVIGDKVQIGAHGTLLHGVTIGAPSGHRLGEMPTLGDHVFVGAGSYIIGEITIGAHVFIGANTVVNRDIPPHSKVVSTADIQITS